MLVRRIDHCGWRSPPHDSYQRVLALDTQSMGGSIWHGNCVSTATRALSDSYRYRFLPRWWKALNPMPNRLNQQWTRLPNAYKGTGAGGACGGTGAALNDCSVASEIVP